MLRHEAISFGDFAKQHLGQLNLIMEDTGRVSGARKNSEFNNSEFLEEFRTSLFQLQSPTPNIILMKGQRNVRLRKRPAEGGAKTELINFLKPIGCEMQLLCPRIQRSHEPIANLTKLIKTSCIIDIICTLHHFGALPSFEKNLLKILIFRPQNWSPK